MIEKIKTLEQRVETHNQPLAVTIVTILGWKWVDVGLAERMIPFLEQRHMGGDYWSNVNRKTAREDCVKIFLTSKTSY